MKLEGVGITQPYGPFQGRFAIPHRRSILQAKEKARDDEGRSWEFDNRRGTARSAFKLCTWWLFPPTSSGAGASPLSA